MNTRRKSVIDLGLGKNRCPNSIDADLCSCDPTIREVRHTLNPHAPRRP